MPEADRIDLPGGAWACLLPSLDEVPRKLTRPINTLRSRMAVLPGMAAVRAQLADGADLDETQLLEALPPEGQEAMLELGEAMSEALVVALTVSWSYPHPVTAQGLGELPTASFDALAAAARDRSRFQVSEATLAAMADPHPSLAVSTG